MFEKHDESVDGKQDVPESDNLHPAVALTSPREVAECTESCSEDEDTEADVLFEELSEWHTLLSVHTAGATYSAIDTIQSKGAAGKTIGVQPSNPIEWIRQVFSEDRSGVTAEEVSDDVGDNRGGRSDDEQTDTSH